jgi:hypothetical protein
MNRGRSGGREGGRKEEREINMNETIVEQDKPLIL